MKADKKAIIYAPGLATKGRSARVVGKIIDHLNRQGEDISLIQVEYPSHAGKNITGFHQDTASIKMAIDRAIKTGFSREQIGCLGICYGSYLTCRYLAENNGTGANFAILVEPYFSIEDLRGGYRLAAKCFTKLPRNIGGAIQLPATNKSKIERWIDIHEFGNFVSQRVPVPNVPTLVFCTNYHHFFNKSNMNYILTEKSAEVVKIDKKEIIEEYPKTMTAAINSFLNRFK